MVIIHKLIKQELLHHINQLLNYSKITVHQYNQLLNKYLIIEIEKDNEQEQEHITWGMQLPHAPVTAFSQTDLFLA